MQPVHIQCTLCKDSHGFAWDESASDVCWLSIEAGLSALAAHLVQDHGFSSPALSIESDPVPGQRCRIEHNGRFVGELVLGN